MKRALNPMKRALKPMKRALKPMVPEWMALLSYPVQNNGCFVR
jgi:hypothetical protein